MIVPSGVKLARFTVASAAEVTPAPDLGAATWRTINVKQAKKNEPVRNAITATLLMSIRLAQLATGRLADSFRGVFVRLSDRVCAVRLIA